MKIAQYFCHYKFCLSGFEGMDSFFLLFLNHARCTREPTCQLNQVTAVKVKCIIFRFMRYFIISLYHFNSKITTTNLSLWQSIFFFSKIHSFVSVCFPSWEIVFVCHSHENPLEQVESSRIFKVYCQANLCAGNTKKNRPFETDEENCESVLMFAYKRQYQYNNKFRKPFD